MDKLDAIVELLAEGATLPLKNYDHELEGNYEGFRECHISPDWLLIYRHEKDTLVLYLFRNGTHSDLF
jgi:mRNA interferase YafQ